MFRKAYAMAREFTRPVIVSTRTVGGKCKSGVASYVVLNPEGWIITAFHVLGGCVALSKASTEVKARLAAAAAVRADNALTPKAKKAKLREIGEVPSDAVQNYASWWSENGAAVSNVVGFPSVDVAVGRLTTFDPASVAVYPAIKDPTKDYEPGASLCKLGYPFHELPIAWDEKDSVFTTPDGTVGLTYFPIEGMLTRFVHDPKWIQEQQAANLPFPLMQIETSTPGLKGQSGGPHFDVDGRVWGIQTGTAHLSLGFDPEVKEKGGIKRKEHQFLNVGRGVHAATIVGLLDQLGVQYRKE